MIKLDKITLYSSSIPSITYDNEGIIYNIIKKEKAYNIYIGEKTIEVLKSCKNKKDGLYTITFMTDNIDYIRDLIINFKSSSIYGDSVNNISSISTLPHNKSIKENQNCHWKYFNITLSELDFVIEFREIKNSTELEKYYKSLVFNSYSNGINTIKEATLSLPYTNKHIEFFNILFPDCYITSDEFSSEIYFNETFTLKKIESLKEVNLELHLNTSKESLKNNTQLIENVKLIL